MLRSASLLRSARRLSFLTPRPTASLRAPLVVSLLDTARRAPRGPLDVAALLETPATIEMPQSKYDDMHQLADSINEQAKEINGGKEPTIYGGCIVPSTKMGRHKLVTPEMLHTASAHMVSFLSGTRFTSAQFYCGWWWFAECDGKLTITEAADHRCPYGWGVRGALVYVAKGGSGGQRGNLLSYFDAFGWLLDYGAITPLDEDLPQLGYDAIAAALECDVGELPRLKRLPVVPKMLAASFVGALCYLPMLHVVACCGNRCRMVCGFKGYTDAQTAVIISDKIWTSLEVHKSTFYFEVPREVLGHGPRKKLKHMHIWCEPCVVDSDFLASRDDSIDDGRRGCSVPTRRATPCRRFPLCVKEGRLLAIRFMHDEEVLGDSTVTKKLWAWLVGAARADLIPIEKEMISLKLAAKATMSGYDVGLGNRCGTSSCRGAHITPRVELIEQGVIQTGKDGVEFFCEPQKDLFASEGMPDARISDLVAEVLQYHEWCRVTPKPHLTLFKNLAKGGMWKRLGPEGDVLVDLLETGTRGYRIASDITSRLKRPPWSRIRGVLKTRAHTYAITTADVKTIAPIAVDVWKWWMDARPEVGMQCRADVFKGWHHIGNQHGANCLTIWNEDDCGKLELVDEDAATGDAPTAAPLDAEAIDAEATAKALEIVGGFPTEFLRRAVWPLSTDERRAGWSNRGENVGKVVVVKVFVGLRRAPHEVTTYAVCVAERHEEVIGKDPFSRERTWDREFRVVFGVVRRRPSSGLRLETHEDMTEAQFKAARLRTPLDVATADALLRALAERRASPPSETPTLTPEQKKIEELKAEIKARDGDPSAVDGWTAELRYGTDWYFIDPAGASFQRMRKVFDFLQLGAPPKKKLRRESSRMTRTPQKAADDEFVEAMGRERQPSCLEMNGMKCVICRAFIAVDDDELTRHRMEVHGLSGDEAVQNPKWPCAHCLHRLDTATYDCSGEVCPSCHYMHGGRRKPFKLERAEDKLRIAKWRRDKGLVE